MIKLSTGLRNALAGVQGYIQCFDKGCIEIYTGPQPLTADAAPSGTLLGIVSVDGLAWDDTLGTNGLTWLAAAGGAAAKSTDQWKFTGLADGTAGWFRLKAFKGAASPLTGNGNSSDVGALSTTHRRMDGSIAVSGADLNLSNISIVTGAPNTIDVFSFTIPAQ